MKLEIQLDRDNAVPLTEQIVTGVSAWIRSRNAHPGSKLPSIRQFAADFGVSRFPVIEAYDRLVSLGYVDSRHGSGFYVADRQPTDMRCQGTSDPRRADVESDHLLEQFNFPGETLKLSTGFIPESWRDIDGIAQAIRHVSRTDPASMVEYATPLGNPVLREQLRGRIGQLGIQADASQILITNGASQAFDLLVRYMLKPGDTIFVEDPGYYNLYGLLRLHGMKLIGIPRTGNGPDLDAMQAQLKLHRPRLLLINTVFHNPTGTTVAPQVAFRLLQMAREHGFQIIEDDIYADFQTELTDRLATLDQLEQVIYIGGLSKTLSSSLRIGCVVASHAIIKDLVDIKMLTSIGCSRFAEAVAVSMLERGAYRKYLERLRRQMRGALGSTVQTLEDAGWEIFAEPAGGKFVWARVPHVADAERLVECGEPLGVTVLPGQHFRPNREVSPWIRIHVAFGNEPRAQAFFHAAAQLPPDA
ncbi:MULTISPECIES: PLP-dependent aminotransferase family protein [unclassified Paraburkholderia]|uniref:aminotransferase-like domain-containing protein n=1 Tax=unclassified Paraburkholderia TaxID=2615204 RepID=UPI0016135B2D|nr:MULTISPECIES: PLP-dependent aminotransferase family protein [unclassified Paraburkholderia]MBB5444319.1 DNA-binding transcriptional MocR family regulator [Paraburkholderia sp. WSM4177]MBB5484566.1 DNA-binding transcriptional MocR family regulator [Paraburkholderia sp. WSM4180]